MNVENWKAFNHDVSEENEFYKLKKEIKEYKLMKMKKEQEKCCCEIFQNIVISLFRIINREVYDF